MKSFLLNVCVVAAIAFFRMSEAHADELGQTPLPAADRMHGKAPGDVRDDNGLKVQLVWCPPGSFTMERVEHIAEAVASKEDRKPDNGNDAVDPKVGPEPRRKIKITPVKVVLHERLLARQMRGHSIGMETSDENRTVEGPGRHERRRGLSRYARELE